MLLDRAATLRLEGQLQSAIATCEAAFSASVREGDIVTTNETLTRLGLYHQHAGDPDLAREYFDLVVTLASLHGDLRAAGRARNNIGALCYEKGQISEAELYYRQARSWAEQADDAALLGYIDQNLGIVATIRGNLDEARNHFESSLRHAEAADGDPHGVARVLNNLGVLHLDLNRPDDALDCYTRALEICRTNGDTMLEGVVEGNLAELFVKQGELERARKHCDHAYEIASRSGNAQIRAIIMRFYGVIYRESGRAHLAEVHLREAIAIAREQGLPLGEAEALRELSLVLRVLNRNPEALEALNRAHHLFSELQASTRQADIDQRLDQLEEDFLTIVHAWGESIEAKDRYTAGHCQRVADYACRIAERTGLSERDLSWFRMGAFLHDVGKTETPAEILNKPGRLTDEELAIMQRHTVAGDELLSSINFPYDVRAMVRSHHERWSGGGYPDGLVGDKIPRTARILRIADVFDALTTSRSYRAPMPPERALEIMEAEHDTYDPDLFEIFRELFPVFAEEVRQLHAERWTSSLRNDAPGEDSAPSEPRRSEPKA